MIVLDANILLEILEERQFFDATVGVLERLASHPAGFGVSTLTVSITFYLAERHKVPVERVEALIRPYKVFDVLTQDVTWALAHYDKTDFEDALQIAAALREKCARFVTLDAGLAATYVAFVPVELVR